MTTNNHDKPANERVVVSDIKGAGFDEYDEPSATLAEIHDAYGHTEGSQPTPDQELNDLDLWEAPQSNQQADLPSNEHDFMFEREYQINATGRQVDDISYACETMARIEIGQMNAIIDALPLKGDTDTYALLQQLEFLVKPHLKENLPHSPFFTMHQSLRHRRSWDIHPEGGMTVNFDEPLILDPKNPLLKVALVSKEPPK